MTRKTNRFFILISGGIFIFGLFVLGLLIKKYLNRKILAYLWVPLISLVIIGTLFFTLLFTIILLFGLMFYGFVSAEAQVIKTIEEKIGFGRIVLMIVSFALIFIYYNIEKTGSFYPSLVFVIQSLFSLITSYTLKQNESIIIYNETPPLWLGLAFMLASISMYFLGNKAGVGSGWDFALPFISIFYLAGAMILYLALNDYIKKQEEETIKKKS